MPDNSREKGFGGLLQLSLLVMLVSVFFAGSFYTRVKVLEKELGVYKETRKVAGVQAETKGNEPALPQPKALAPSAPSVKGEVNITKDDHINGSSKARILLVEYSDMECPYCKKFHPTAQQIVDNFKGEVAWVYRHLPLVFHANAQKEAEASECANELGGNSAFWKYTNAIFARTNSGGTGFALEDLTPLAEEIGLDSAKFQTCLDSDKYVERIKNDSLTATGLGVTGTPGNILLDTKTGKTAFLPGAYPYEDFEKAIQGMLAE